MPHPTCEHCLVDRSNVLPFPVRPETDSSVNDLNTIDAVLTDDIDEFWFWAPIRWDEPEWDGMPLLGFKKFRDHVSELGYVCAEVHQGPGHALCEAGIPIPGTKGEVVFAGRFVRHGCVPSESTPI